MLSLIRFIHNYGSYVPFISLVLMTAVIIDARLVLGYFPIYGVTPEPPWIGRDPNLPNYSNNTSMMLLYSSSMLSLTISVLIVIAWIVCTLIGVTIYREDFKLNHFSTIVFGISVSSFHIIEWCFPNVFMWYMD